LKRYSAAYASIQLKQIKRKHINCCKIAQQAKFDRYMHTKDAAYVLCSNDAKQNTEYLKVSMRLW